MSEGNQIRVGATGRLMAMFNGEDSVTCRGTANEVVNDQVLEAAAEPELFFATTFQKYVVPDASAGLTARLVAAMFCAYKEGGLVVPRYRS